VLVLDEPTNDLDLETLELLEAQLVEWSGTLLLVSHDRAFLDNVITSTIVFEGQGRVDEYVGGYEDWLRQSARVRHDAAAVPNPPVRKHRREHAPDGGRKLTYREQVELQGLPGRIDALEAEQRELSRSIADPMFYREPAASIRQALDRTAAIERELIDLYARWEALDSRAG
jgi:ATP-binding cassette subfamily F protein uup